MALIVEVFRKDRDEKDRLVIDFKFSKWEWEKLIAIAVENGWKQIGTFKPLEKDFFFFKRDYSPEYPFHKIIATIDAQDWAKVLWRYFYTKHEYDFKDVIVPVEGSKILRACYSTSAN